jgi:aminopeptidase N
MISPLGQAQEKGLPQTSVVSARQHYRIEIDLDYHAARFTGREAVRFENLTRQELDSVSFHLYPNVGLSEDEPLWLTVQRVSAGQRELRYSLKSRGAVLRVELPHKLEPGKSLELTLDFSATIPRVQREETSLLAHFLQEVNDALNDDRQPRDARDIFFAGEQAMLLGYFYPMLATRQVLSSDYSLMAGGGGVVLSDVADYEVAVKVNQDLVVAASGISVGSKSAGLGNSSPYSRREYLYRGEKLRGFALMLGEGFKTVEKRVGNSRVISYFREGDERLGQRVLEIASRATEVYAAAFGEYPYPVLNVIEMPLPAGYSGIDFPGLVALAQAYYIDFEAPQAARLPGIVREQADLIKAALEFTLAHGTAHQWWGGVIGSDPQRSPYLDEALANYSAVYYYEAAYGRAAGELAVEQQLRAPYQAYRMLGGTDMEVDKSAKDFRSALQYTAIVQAKGAMLFIALRQELGDEHFFAALRYYYQTHRFKIASPEHLRATFLAAAEEQETVKTLFQRWIKEKHGDEDLGVSELALNAPQGSKVRTLGRLFARIGRTAARPF